MKSNFKIVGNDSVNEGFRGYNKEIITIKTSDVY